MPAITVSSPGAGAVIGPGLSVFYSIAGGPIPNDDFVSVQWTRISDGAGGPVGDHITSGNLTGHVVIGYTEVNHDYLMGNMFSPGDALQYFVYLSHANGSITDVSINYAATYNPVNALWGLIAKEIRLAPAGDTRVFPPN